MTTLNTAQLRAWLEVQVEACRSDSFPDVPVYYENTDTPAEKDMPANWVDVQLNFLDGRNVTVGTRPRGRDTAVLHLSVYTRGGEGTQEADGILDALREHFRQNRRYGSLTLDFPARGKPTNFNGWHGAHLSIPLRNDSE